jgi:Reverse transcriptase (RNA-dependent DNA polymerase)
VDGSKQVRGENYWETYTPVASWSSIRLIMCMAAQQGWKTKQLDFVQAYPQAPAEVEMYIDIPKGCKVGNGDNSKYALKIINNIYGQKQAGKVWNDFLICSLTEQVGFTQSQYDPCVLCRGNVIIIYTDDTIVTGENDEVIDKSIKDIG